MLIYGLIINNRGIKIIDKTGYIFQPKISKASDKYRMVFTSLNNVFSEVYNTVIYKIYIFLYNIKLCIKFIKAFSFGQKKIC